MFDADCKKKKDEGAASATLQKVFLNHLTYTPY